jgi:(E)-4-hydroxy-3-methyl-but-2-enyl pyrophosphate reductase
MKVILAKTAGFCWGVKRAVHIALDARKNSPGKVLTHGPLIHNQRVVDKLNRKGIGIYNEQTPLSRTKKTLIIRAHGISPKIKNALISRGFSMVDATCPHVVKAQKIVEQYAHKYYIVIAGDVNHAEVVGLTGYAYDKVAVIGSVKDLDRVHLSEPILFLAQSTFNENEFKKIAAYLCKKYKNVLVKNTICSATSSRQKEIIALAKKVDALVVVGDTMSANTKRLVAIAQEHHASVYFVEGADALNTDVMKQYSSVGVTAGASTPEWETKAVVKKLHIV